MASTQTVLWSRVLDRLDGPNPPDLIVIDPRRSPSAKKATVHLAPRIGTNLALLNGIQHLLFRDSYINNDFLDKHVVGLDRLRETVKLSTPALTEQITGVASPLIEQAAKIIGESDSLLSTCLQGVYQSNQATASACAVNNINLLMGHIGKPGSGIFQMNGQPTAQNNRESGCDGEFPGFRNFSNPNHMQELADIWNIEYRKLPHWNQPTHIENMLNYIASGTMEMFWISGTNPMVSLPNLNRVRKLLSKPELFVVAQDIFPNETTAIADVVLPAAAWGEKTGCFTNVDRTVHLSHKAVEPPGEARSDLDIFVDFSNRMKFMDKEGKPLIPWNTPEGGFAAFKKLTRGRPCDYSSLTYEKLKGGSGIQWPCTEDYPNGKERLFDDGIFFTDIEYCESYGHDLETGAPISKEGYKQLNPNGRAILKSCHYIPSAEMPSKDYPIALSTGRNKYHFHTRSKTGRVRALQDAAPEAHVRISVKDAREVGVKDGDQVTVRSVRGEVQLQADVGDIADGQAFIPFHYGYFDSKDNRSRAANELTQDQWDPVSKQPLFKGGAIRIERCTDQEKVEAEEKHSDTVDRVADTKAEACEESKPAKRETHISLWLGATDESMKLFSQACSDTLPKLIHDLEVQAGIHVLKRIAEEAIQDLAPFLRTYGADENYGRHVSVALGETLFPWHNDKETSTAYGTLVVLQGLYIYLSNTQGHVIALGPAAQALWDEQFTNAIRSAQTRLKRCVDWIQQQIMSRAPQTLTVPSKNLQRQYEDDSTTQNQRNPKSQT